MQVVLLSDTEGLGKKGDLITVADGHAKNYLIPKGKATLATAGLIRKAETMRQNRELAYAKDLQDAKEIRDRLSGTSITIGAKVTEGGKLYGSVTETDIINALSEQQKITLQKDAINLGNPIRELGNHKVRLSLHQEVDFQLDVEILSI